MAYFYHHRYIRPRPCGTKRDSPDNRDIIKTFTQPELLDVRLSRTSVDLRRYVHEVYDQGEVGSCTANALCAAYSLDLEKQPGYTWFDPSRLFLYFNGHLKRNEQSLAVSSDRLGQLYETCTWVPNWDEEGLSIREGLKALNRFGLCTEKDWTYSDSSVDVRRFPSTDCYTAAKGNTCKYERLEHDICHLKACLKQGWPFVFVFKVYESFDNSSYWWPSNVMPRPSGNYRGLHAVMAVGYDDSKSQVIVLNSWGSDWGDSGYFYMPYNIITDKDVCYDFWKISAACVSGRCPQLAASQDNFEIFAAGRNYSQPPGVLGYGYRLQ